MLLVTGGTGFIGSSLVKYLIEKNYEVKLFVRNKQKAKYLFGDKINIVKGVFSKKNDIQKAVKGVDTVIHFAGTVKLKPKEEVYESNFLITKNLLKECKKVDKFIFSSTVDVYGPTKIAVNENYPCNPIDIYGQSKLEAEKIIVQSGIDYSILRIAIVYGIGAQWWKRALDFLKFGFVPKTNNVTHFIHVSDVVKAIGLAIKKSKKNSIYNIANEKPIKIKSAFRYIVELFNKKPIEMPLFITKTIATVLGIRDVIDVALMNRKISVLKAKKELGFESKADMKKMLMEMVESYKNT